MISRCSHYLDAAKRVVVGQSSVALDISASLATAALCDQAFHLLVGCNFDQLVIRPFAIISA